MLLVLSACASKKAEKRYPMQGEIMALDASAHTATIAAGKIGDWMEAMTMEYPVKPDAEFQKLRVVVDKTGGPAEHEGMTFLEGKWAAHRGAGR